jgi:DNA-binding transcriptional ArsR family regulator
MAASESKNCVPFLKALADETRWGIVQELLADPLNVSDLAKRMKTPQYNISKHLRILRGVGIVQTSKRGRRVQCRITPAFRRRLAKNHNQLDLGCCTFRFDEQQR